jgi:hypothetical protein
MKLSFAVANSNPLSSDQPDRKANGMENMTPRVNNNPLSSDQPDRKAKWYTFILDDATQDGLECPSTAYVDLEEDLYKAEWDLAEKYRSFVSEIMRLSLAGIGVFPFLIVNIRPPMKIPLLGLGLAGIGIICLATSIFFALRFMFGASEGLRWYIAGLRFYKRGACCRIRAEATLHQNIAAFSGSETLYVDVCRQDFGLCNSLRDDSQKARDALVKRAGIIQRCRHDKSRAASYLSIGAVCMAFATISAFIA